MNFLRLFFPANIIIMALSLMSYVSGQDIIKYQDDVPYDTFLYNAEPVIVDANTKIESGQASSNSKVLRPGKLYVISSDLKIPKDTNWGGDTKSLVLGNSWEDTSISIIVIKHPENKPIVIEGNGNTTITLGRATLIDVQSPVIFKNVRIHRAYDGPDSKIYKYNKNEGWQLGSYGLYSSAIIVRTSIKFENCTFSTANGGGVWSDVHCTTPGTSALEFFTNTYNIKHFYINSNLKGSTIPFIKTNEKTKIQSFVSAISGTRENVAVTSAMVNDINNSDITYFPVENFNFSKGKVFYITKSNPTENELDEVKTHCIQFLQKYCNYPTNENSINFEVYTSPFAEEKNTDSQQLMPQSEYDGKKDITKYQDTAPYDGYLYNNGQKKLLADENTLGGINILSLVSMPGILPGLPYVIDSNMKLTHSVTWGGNNLRPVIGNSWQNTSATIIVIKHPQNKPITIESANNSTISLERGVILDIQSPVIFKNVKIYRSPNASSTVIKNQSNGQDCKTSAGNTLWSGCIIARAPIKFQNCTLLTPGGTGAWCDIHCFSSYAPLIEFENNKYETTQIYIYKNTKLSTIPLLKVSSQDISRFNSFIKTDGTKNNISISYSMLEDINNNNIKYFSVEKFDKSKGKILYVSSSKSTTKKDDNDIWYAKVADTDNNSDLSEVKKQCIQFLQKYCGFSNANTDVNTEVYTSPFASTLSIAQLLAKTGYIDIDMEANDENGFPADDWNQTIKAGILPLNDSSNNVSEINVGVIGTSPLEIKASEKINTIKLNGDWSQYTGILTIPSNITKVCLSEKDVPFGINASHNIEIDCENYDTLNFSGDFSKCTGTLSFSKQITKILLPSDKVPFTIGGNSTISIGTSSPDIDTMTFKSDILNHKGKILIEPNIKTVILDK